MTTVNFVWGPVFHESNLIICTDNHLGCGTKCLLNVTKVVGGSGDGFCIIYALKRLRLFPF